MSKRLLLLHGPNLNLLGQRDASMYGSMTLAELEASVRNHAESLGASLDCIQSNVEGELVNALHEAQASCHGIVFNPGGYSHTSVAIQRSPWLVITMRSPMRELLMRKWIQAHGGRRAGNRAGCGGW